MQRLTNFRMRSQVDDAHIRKVMRGRVLTKKDYDVLLTGPSRVHTPEGQHVVTYLPGILQESAADFFDKIRIVTRPFNNTRKDAAGAGDVVIGGRSQAGRYVNSLTTGYVESGVSEGSPHTDHKCRLTSWTGAHADEFSDLFPLFQKIGKLCQLYTPQEWRRQMSMVDKTDPSFVIAGTPYTTVTVNHDYPTGVHKDSGDLTQGISCLFFVTAGHKREGPGGWGGGELVFPSFRVAVDPSPGDLLLMDAHQWHGNCDLQNFDAEAGHARTSVVLYYRTKMVDCAAPV